MTKEILFNRIKSNLNDTEKLKHYLVSLQNVDLATNPNAYNELSTNAAYQAERITERLRRIIYTTTNIPKAEYLHNAAEHLSISVDRTQDGIVEIILPCLIPKRSKNSTNFIIDPLHVKLSEFTLENNLGKFRECVVCFINVYDKDLPERRVRDHDNIEMKSILDTINAYLLVDDGGLLCEFFCSSKLGDSDYTQIFIMHKDMFPKWVLRYENAA